MLSKIRSQGGVREGGIRFNAALKVASTLLLVVLLSLSHSFFFILFAGALILVLLSFQRAELIVRVLKVSLPVAAFTFVILLPSVIWGNSPGVVMITAKVVLSVAAVKLLSATTEWGSVTRALKFFFIPDLFILVLDITVRYIVLLGDFSLAMLYALRLRSVGRNRGKAASLSGIAGTLFLKSREMAEDMYAAMACRCFTGSYRIGNARRLSLVDCIPFAIDGLLLFIFFVAGA
jgi:cobalt/nickel transport system permease protein